MEDEEPLLQPKVESSSVSAQGDFATAPSSVRHVLNSPGQSLRPETRAYFEPRFGCDFSDVRVHTDNKSAESAQAVNALAYTVGRDMVFGNGLYSPVTSRGRQLLAHELAHTVQQSGTAVAGARSAGRMRAEGENSAHSVTDSHPVRLAAGQARRVIQRQQPRVQVRSPVFEETVTQLSDVAGGAGGRPLMAAEVTLAEAVFGSSIDYSRVRLVAVNALQFRTVGNNIYIPNDFSIADADHAQTLIHELTHVWQYQHGGTSYISRSLVAQIGGALRGSRNLAYDYTLVPGASFFDFNPEQQGLIVENYYSMKRDEQEITSATAAATGTTAATKQYVANHMDSAGNWRWISATDRLAEIQRELPLHEPLLAQVRASMPQPEADLLQQRAFEGIRSRGQELFPVPEERQLMPVKPLLEVRF